MLIDTVVNGWRLWVTITKKWTSCNLCWFSHSHEVTFILRHKPEAHVSSDPETVNSEGCNIPALGARMACHTHSCD